VAAALDDDIPPPDAAKLDAYAEWAETRYSEPG